MGKHKLSKYFKKSIKNISITFEYVCSINSDRYIIEKNIIKKVGLKYSHKEYMGESYLFKEVIGVKPDVLKKYGYKNVDAFLNFIAKGSDQSIKVELINYLSKDEINSLLDILASNSTATKHKVLIKQTCLNRLIEMNR
jgi:hypothetical protein